MPSNLADEFSASGLDPVDIATLFAGLRNSVPLGLAFRSGELNVGEDEELAKRRGPRTEPARPRTYEDEQRSFEAQFPDPKIRSAVLAELIAQRTQPYHPATATRRADFAQAPEGARQSMQPMARKKFADGGPVLHEHTTPDMADGGQILPDPQPYNKGGGVKKTLDEMQAELFKKGAKAADKPDLARRSFFGLGPQSSFPLANLDTKALEKMQSELKGAPSITEKSVTVDPGKGGMSETIKSVAATPMSRRSVLQSAAGQVMRGALPTNSFADLMNPATVVEQAVQAAAPAVPMSVQGLMAQAIKNGLDVDEAVALVKRQAPKIPEDRLEDMATHMTDPYEWMSYEQQLKGDSAIPGISPSEALRRVIGDYENIDRSPMGMRGQLRDIKKVDPEKYKELTEFARDASKYGFED
jgi:hypothetical protein